MKSDDSKLIQLPTRNIMPPKTVADYCSILDELMIELVALIVKDNPEMTVELAVKLAPHLEGLRNNLNQLAIIDNPDYLDYLLAILAADLDINPMAIFNNIEDWVADIWTAAAPNTLYNPHLTEDRHATAEDTDTYYLTTILNDNPDIGNIFAAEQHKPLYLHDAALDPAISSLSFYPTSFSGGIEPIVIMPYETVSHSLEQLTDAVKAMLDWFGVDTGSGLAAGE